MATIKAIEGRSVHQIQSGQVIVDLCSVVKELLENSLDSGASSIDVRFKNNGLESIEVQDNGGGIAPEDYKTLALKHHTSKLSSYEDLTTLNTFGFRGEALSSLCALSRFYVVTARQEEAPKGKRLEFEVSGKLKDVAVAACQKGTTVVVEELFHNLPVRRRELEKNIKREYSKVLGLLHAYACISAGVRITVSSQMPKGKKVTVFSTNLNTTTRDNIANVFGAKTLPGLTALDLQLSLQTSTSQPGAGMHGQDMAGARQVKISGHVSRPIFGEGRQAPDRQMFFVNSRPCGLPQIAKAFNEVYKSYNVSQSPFIFANLLLDTNTYDVNVSPDKRTILLHDQAALLETLKASLNDLFQAQDQTVPEAQPFVNKLPAYRPSTIPQQLPSSPGRSEYSEPRIVAAAPLNLTTLSSSALESSDNSLENNPGNGLLKNFVERNHDDRKPVVNGRVRASLNPQCALNSRISESKQHLINSLKHQNVHAQSPPSTTRTSSPQRPSDLPDEEVTSDVATEAPSRSRIVQDFNDRMASQQARLIRPLLSTSNSIEDPSSDEESSAGVAAPAIARHVSGQILRPLEPSHEANLPVLSSRISAVPKSPTPSVRPLKRRKDMSNTNLLSSRSRPGRSQFAHNLRNFAAPGSRFQSTSARLSASDVSISESEVESEAEGEEPGSQAKESAFEGEKADEHGRPCAEDETEVGSDSEYLDEDEKRCREEQRVAELIQDAETAAAQPTQANQKRAALLSSSSQAENSTLNLSRFLDMTITMIEAQFNCLQQQIAACQKYTRGLNGMDDVSTDLTAEERLSLTILRSDFEQMRIVGQFNLGFVLTTRPSRAPRERGPYGGCHRATDDLFIIDQHASDEIYNFTRLTKTTTLTPQPLVRPHQLELTAVEEETISLHADTLARNGFTIDFDVSGESPVGRRCKLMTLPTSRDTTFDTRDLEELMALLHEATPAAGEVLRPSKVRRMLAMRACRSSIMVGRTLTRKRMEIVVRHMGEIERPWNCPHGRPTMRHLAGLNEWRAWSEGDGLTGDSVISSGDKITDWAGFMAQQHRAHSPRAEIVAEDAHQAAKSTPPKSQQPSTGDEGGVHRANT